jgi:DNA-binding NtrC family response regulator
MQKAEGMLGISDKTLRVYKELSRAVQSPFNVVLEGESGVGKQHLAKLIHKGRKRRGEFVVFDCERGNRGQTSMVERFTSPTFLEKLRHSTMKDTLFIRRIDLLQGHLLAQLSDFLEELGNAGAFPRNMFLSLGVIGSLLTSEHKESLNNARLHKLLDYLFCLRIGILPLRERKREIPHLVDEFITLFNREEKRSVLGITRDALSLLIQYHWPDNVRELGMEIERAATLTGDYQSIEASSLSEYLLDFRPSMRSFDKRWVN